MKHAFLKIAAGLADAIRQADAIAWSPADGWTELGKRLIPVSPLASDDLDDATHDVARWLDDGGAHHDRDC